MKTKDQLFQITIKDMATSDKGFKLAIVELLADIRNLFIFAIVSDDSDSTYLSKVVKSALKEMGRLLTEESKDKDNKP